MLAKIYIDQAISSREDTPDTIPGLMLNYVSRLNKSIPQEKRKTTEDIHQTVQEIAWLCLKKDYHPRSIDQKLLVEALVSRNEINSGNGLAVKEGIEKEVESRLSYLKINLPVIQVDEETNHVSFRLDPLAEYFAALRLLQYCGEVQGEEAQRWKDFLDSVDQKKSPRITMQGFLLAVWDTCRYHQKYLQSSIPEYVQDEVISRANLTEEELSLARQTRQIQQLITNLQEWNEPNLVKELIEKLGEFGEASRSAVPYLIEKLLFEELRPTIGNALVNIGLKAIPELIQSLSKGKIDIRRSIAKILGEFELGIEDIIPGLIGALNDDDMRVKKEAILSISRFGKKAEMAVHNFIFILENVNEHSEIRRYAAKALGAVGSHREDAGSALQRIMKSSAEESNVRLTAIQALQCMGKEVLPFVATIHGNDMSLQPIDMSMEIRFEELDKDVVLEMILIPGGSFMMGSPTSEEGHDESEGPQRRVDIYQFFMSKYPVTQAQWKVVSSYPKVDREIPSSPSKFCVEPNCPVETVSWLDAMEFCARLSSHTGQEYRLPSEAEWEYACRAGMSTPFHFGETITTDLSNYCGMASKHNKLKEKYRGFYGQGSSGEYRESTTVVGQFGVVNAFGLHDMHGNVWEMCADPWHDDYLNAPISGGIWDDDDAKVDYRVMRGGAWDSDPKLCRSACRNLVNLEACHQSIGFRICLSAENHILSIK
jgi:formylglycine-generating enzyme required for sulfatase activity